MILEEITRKRKEDVERRKKEFPLEWLGRSLAYNPYVPRDAKKALQSTQKNPYKIIAEIKKASPSKGIIKDDFEPILIAKEYYEGKADAISVLTEPNYFLGDIEYITQVRRYVPLPILRKDFIFDKYQLVEALVYGADFVLLIARMLSTKELKTLLEYCWHLGMEALVEIHNKKDLTKAIFCGANIIGINHRNLETFEIDFSLSEKLIPLIPKNKIIVAESGINSFEQIKYLHSMGADAFLIGEFLMKEKSIPLALSELKNLLSHS
jgi:indole-3-glycerol phosphate synthase